MESRDGYDAAKQRMPAETRALHPRSASRPWLFCRCQRQPHTVGRAPRIVETSCMLRLIKPRSLGMLACFTGAAWTAEEKEYQCLRHGYHVLWLRRVILCTSCGAGAEVGGRPLAETDVASPALITPTSQPPIFSRDWPGQMRVVKRQIRLYTTRRERAAVVVVVRAERVCVDLKGMALACRGVLQTFEAH